MMLFLYFYMIVTYQKKLPTQIFRSTGKFMLDKSSFTEFNLAFT